MKSRLTQSILAGIPLPLLVIGRDARILLANAAAETLLGSTLVSRHFVTVLRQPSIIDAVETALEARKTAKTRVPITTAGQEHVYQVLCEPIEDERQQGAVVSFEDLSPMEGAEQMRRDFVANVSHELRTPLTALSGFIETLGNTARDDPAARERFLKIMGHEAGRMNRLIDELLILSRLEGQERMRPTDQVDLSGVAHSVVHRLQPQAAEAGITLEVAGADGPVPVLGDGDQLVQVVSNLVENALKYGGERGSAVRITLHPPVPMPALRADAVQLDVVDDGAGIDAVHVARLTERFYRVDSHRSREVGGTGLGLAIVKHIVNRHRGRLKITSTPGQGSCFSVFLPVD